VTNASSIKKICVIGSGGREHVLAWTLAQNADVVVTPGSDAMVKKDGRHSVAITHEDPLSIDADLFVIGPEVPLVEGIADSLRAKGKLVLGPGSAGAQLEGSKAFMKEMTKEAGIPTARFGVFDEVEKAVAFLNTLGETVVIKTDGLAAGKGVLVTATHDEAIRDIRAKLSGEAFGNAGARIVVEEGLVGTECSLLALCDGTDVVSLTLAQDHKRIGEGDTGANTGGMGAYAPVSFVSDAQREELVALTITPMIEALKRRGIDYRGVLYAGIMLTTSGPMVLEYNVRLGDPEAQAVLALMGSETADLFAATASGTLATYRAQHKDAHSAKVGVCVVLAAQGYPEKPVTGAFINGLGDDGQLLEPIEGVTVYHAGTKRSQDGKSFVVNGGRVLSVTAVGETFQEARKRAYRGVDQISWPTMRYRRDIGAKMLEAKS
jgi:phosphoribosylamine--glycine ligase